jgi:hypothetical protein|tara:strand:+ start:680 stop:793 length:114 start_codon:yes stop_codon:yes gene_type:complete
VVVVAVLHGIKTLIPAVEVQVEVVLVATLVLMDLLEL